MLNVSSSMNYLSAWHHNDIIMTYHTLKIFLKTLSETRPWLMISLIERAISQSLRHSSVDIIVYRLDKSLANIRYHNILNRYHILARMKCWKSWWNYNLNEWNNFGRLYIGGCFRESQIANKFSVNISSYTTVLQWTVVLSKISTQKVRSRISEWSKYS